MDNKSSTYRPNKPKRKKSKKPEKQASFLDRLITCIITTGLLLSSAFISYGLENEPDRAQTPAPEVSAKTAVVMELRSGKVLYEKNAYDQVYPASTTKILTALLAVENFDMEETVKVPEDAVGVEGSSIYLTVDEKLPMSDLVYGLMLRSGNDAAVAIAQLVGGSTDEFMDMMNQRAKEIGAEDTNFITPNGLHDDNHYTTAYDMALIAREAMKNEDFRQVVGAKSYQAHRDEGLFNYFANKNKVVYEYEGGTGIKIGYTTTAGRTLVASSKRDGMELICVVMGAPDWFNDTYKLMDYIYEGYEPVKLLGGNEPLMAIHVNKGEKGIVQVGAGQNIMCPAEKGKTTDNITIEYVTDKNVSAPVKRWQEAGEIRIYNDGELLFTEPLYYLEDIGKK